MSQLQVTGEAKIREIQGPVVANDGVITALDGAANQYVRGDGTLAIFPTSGGGGSSVSYYLNGSVNQGTFGGSTYYQMSKDAITGLGTNFSTSTNGLLAQFITDVNVPDVTEIPSGNWNLEFFMNVSASSGALASFYAEIYKWNGTTFTLIATNVATPEQLTNTTTVDAYFTSVAMPTTALAITDRIAIRIYANVAGKTVTLYTEDNRLCQVVTTFSRGVTSINNLTDQSQYLTTGTSGTNFNIVSSGDTHTFNLPVASATNTGKLSSTDWTTFNNKQNALTNPITGLGSSGQVSYFNGANSITGQNLFNFDGSNVRLGVNTVVPNATIGANAGIDSGYSLLLKNAESNYNGIGFATDSTYGNLISTEKLGTALTRNLTLLNQSGYISLTEAGNLGVNILNPNNGVDIYNSTNSFLWLHNAASGTTSTDGVRLALFSTRGANLRNFDGSFSITAEGDFSIITLGAENFRVNSADGSIYQSKVANDLLKSVSGVITAAVAGTDYVVPSALNNYVPTSRTLSINGVTYDLSANRSWTITAGISGSGASGQITYFNGTTSVTSEALFNYDSILKRFGVNTNTPNATMGANANLDSGYSLLLKNSDTNYNGIGFSTDTTYGNLIETVRLGSASVRNLTMKNNNGFISISETGSFGFNTLANNLGVDIYSATNTFLLLHNGTGTSTSTGARLAFFSTKSLNLRNFEGPISFTAEGDFSVITLGTENIRVNSANGFVGIGSPSSITSMLTVNGSITQSVTSALLKTNASGTIIQAVAGTDYVVGSSINGTINRIPVFTGTGSIGDSGIFDNGTNVIFGGTLNTSANPTVVMQNRLGTVLSVAGFNFSGTTADNNSTNSLMILGGYLNTSAQTVATATNASGMQFFNGGFYWYGNSGLTIGSVYTNTQRMFLTVGGNLIIGSGADAGFRLDVSGTARVTGLLTGSTATFSGNVGIGTSPTTNPLHIIATAPVLAIESNTTGNVFLRMLQAGTIVSSLFYNNATSTLTLSNNNAGIQFNTSGLSSALAIASSGAATFGSTVTVSSTLFMNAYSFASSAIQFTRATTDVIAPGSGNGILVFGGGTSQIRIGTDNTLNIDVNNSGSPLNALKVQQGGNVVFGGYVSTNSGLFSSAWNIYIIPQSGYWNFNGAGITGLGQVGTGTLYSNGGTVTTINPSDSLLKNTIEDYQYGLNEILKLTPKTFYYNSDIEKSSLKYGFIAQDVESIMPDAVRKLNPEKEDSKLGLEIDAIYVAMVNAIKELKAEIDILKNK